MKAFILIACVIVACCPKPEVVTVHRPCMTTPPSLRPVTWPEPDTDGIVHLDPPTQRKLLMLIASLRTYLEVQLARCRVP